MCILPNAYSMIWTTGIPVIIEFSTHSMSRVDATKSHIKPLSINWKPKSLNVYIHMIAL